jgi:hypothetical protein
LPRKPEQQTRLLINLSTGVSLDSTLEERIRPVKYHRPQLAFLNPGTRKKEQ